MEYTQKPTRKYHEAVYLMQRLLDIMTGLRKVRESVPREEAIVNVLSERRDMVSFAPDPSISSYQSFSTDFVRLHWLVCL